MKKNKLTKNSFNLCDIQLSAILFTFLFNFFHLLLYIKNNIKLNVM